MNKTYRPVLVVIAIFAAVMATSHFFSSDRAGAAELIAWRHDLAAARTEAAAAHKPVLAYFTATWCGPCQQMHRTTWSDPKVDSALKAYIPVKIDVDENPKLAANYGINGIPSYLVLDDQGKAVRREDGYRSADEFLDWLHGK